MFRDPGLHVVLEPDDDRGHLDFVRSLHAPEDGRLVCDPMPRSGDIRSNFDWLLHDLLRTLEKDAGGILRNSSERLNAVISWLMGDEVRDLFLLRANRASAGVWTRVATDIAGVTGIRCWFLCPGAALRRGHREWAQHWGAERMNFEDFASRWEDKSQRTNVAATTEPYPMVPDTDFLLFRQTARELLAPADFARVDKTFKQVLDRTTDWLDKTDQLDADQLAAYLRRLISDCSFTGEALARLHAAQAALLLAGWWVQVDMTRFRFVLPDAAVTLNETVVRTLRRLAQPHYAAIPVVALVCGASDSDIAALRLADADPTGCALRVCGVEHAIPSFAAPLLRACIIWRRTRGARDSDPLFADRVSQAPNATASAKAIRAALSRVGREVGVRCGRGSEATNERSMRRLGVRLERVT